MIRRLLWLCSSLSLAACGDPTPPPAADGWQRVFEGNLDRLVLGVTGRSDADVYLAGGGFGSGTGSLAAHYDGTEWSDLEAPVTETLWWVWPDPGSGDVWWVGDNGTILRSDASGAMTAIDSGVTETLYGVWGRATDDVYIVGGDPRQMGELDLILHWNGESLERVTDAPKTHGPLFKIWGVYGGPMWISGAGGGMLMNRADGSWEDQSDQIDVAANLLTVHGCAADDVYAVGGQSLVHYDGATWQPVDIALFSTVNGVACADEGVLVVGNGGLKVRYDRAMDRWFDEQFDEPYDTDFHGAWLSPSGAHWAVGGNFQTPAGPVARVGVVAYHGDEPPADSL